MARRRYQSGSLKLSGTARKKWVLIWREDVVGDDGAIQRIQRTTNLGFLDEVPTKKLARRKADETLAKVNATDYRPSRPIEFREFAERWKTTMVPLLKPSSQKHTKGNLDRYLLPAFGAVTLNEIELERVQAFVSSLAGKVRRHTVRNVLASLSSICKTARSWGYTVGKWSREDLVIPVDREPKRVRVFSPAEARAVLLRAAQPWRAFFGVAAMCGLRGGEICALQVDDVDFEAGTIHVRQAVWYGHIQPPKSPRSIRTVPMPGVLQGILQEHLERTWKSNAGRLLFHTQRGTVLNPERVVARHLYHILDELGIPLKGLHAFRHGLASLFLSSGASPTVTQAQLGHTDPRVTLGIYAHLVGDEQRVAADRVAGMLWSDVIGAGGSPGRIN
jgi:integrase